MQEVTGNSIQHQSPLQSFANQGHSGVQSVTRSSKNNELNVTEKNHSIDQDVTESSTLQQSPLKSLKHLDHSAVQSVTRGSENNNLNSLEKTTQLRKI